MIGDLPEADAKPPTNMLFVCKLNPVRLLFDMPTRAGFRTGLAAMALALCALHTAPNRTAQSHARSVRQDQYLVNLHGLSVQILQ